MDPLMMAMMSPLSLDPPLDNRGLLAEVSPLACEASIVSGIVSVRRPPPPRQPRPAMREEAVVRVVLGRGGQAPRG